MTRDLLVAPLKMLCLGPCGEILTLTLAKKYKKYKQNVLSMMVSTLYAFNLQ